MITMGVFAWLASSALSHGLMFGYFEGEYHDLPRVSPFFTLIPSVVFGPIALVATLLCLVGWGVIGKYGMKFWGNESPARRFRRPGLS